MIDRPIGLGSIGCFSVRSRQGYADLPPDKRSYPDGAYSPMVNKPDA